MTDFEPMYPDDTLVGFNCCVSLPADCEDCPLFSGERLPIYLDHKRMEKCKEILKDNVRYWLSKAEIPKP